jgi:hypothetical protein
MGDFSSAIAVPQDSSLKQHVYYDPQGGHQGREAQCVKREVAAVDTSPENSNRNADESDNGQELQYQLQDFEWSHAAGYVSGGNADDV